jgi:hypothetical protein
MPTINATNFNGKGKFHKCLVRAIALVSLSFIEFSLGTVITAPALALDGIDLCSILLDLPWCPYGSGGGGFEPPLEPKPSKEPKEPNPKPSNQPQPKPPSQPKPDPFVCNKKPDLPQCN